MINKGKFIVIEGSDGVGKNTQAQLLIKNLRKLGKNVAYHDFPQYESSFFGKLVAKYLNGDFGDVDDVDPRLASILYAGDRFEAAPKIKKDLASGKVIICNRYTQSSMAFQSAKLTNNKEKSEFLKWLEELEFRIFNIPRPDLVIYLYAPHKISQKMIDNKSKRSYTSKKRDIHERNSNFLMKVEREYLALSKQSPMWKTIICTQEDKMLSPDQISVKVLEAVHPRL